MVIYKVRYFFHFYLKQKEHLLTLKVVCDLQIAALKTSLISCNFPAAQSSMRGSQSAGGRFTFTKQSKSGMRVMADSIRSETPRPKSPHMNNEEPIELAHFPDAKKPKPGQQPKIERDDFPAPPYPYTDPGKTIILLLCIA